ncbi:hypothetical protein LSAT2_025927 [Lamellibrachia satsuma]|nr:hypothetical protein LSAT2_025927 [Lamellibrachia satsuma]
MYHLRTFLGTKTNVTSAYFDAPKRLLERLLVFANDVLPEAQCGFRLSSSTIDMIFTLRQLQEKAAEQNKPLYIAFADFSKAFDSISRPCLW